jgi:hypothetical protein
MRRLRLPVLSLAVILPASADFSYVRTTKTSASPTIQTTKQFLKGQKLRMEHGDVASIVDFTSRTITTIDNKRKVYTVHRLPGTQDAQKTVASPSPATPPMNADMRETGQKKKIGAYHAKEVVLTMDAGTSPITGNQMQLEAEVWLASDVPGMRELQAFQREGNAMSPAPAAGGASAGLEKMIAGLQQKTAGMDGLPVLQVVKIRSSKDGPAMIEMTMETSGFSTASLADSLFAVPAGYRKSGAAGAGKPGTKAPPAANGEVAHPSH